MMDFLLYALMALSLAIAVMAYACIRAGVEYDRWVEEFNREGIQTALEPVLHGSEVVGYTVVQERRCRAR